MIISLLGGFLSWGFCPGGFYHVPQKKVDLVKIKFENIILCNTLTNWNQR